MAAKSDVARHRKRCRDRKRYQDNKERLSQQQRARYHENKETVLAQQRAYYRNNREAILEKAKARYERDPQVLKERMAVQRRKAGESNSYRYQNDPEYRRKKIATRYVNCAVYFGDLVRSKVCEDCGSLDAGGGRGVMHGHHEDYDKPLDVVWLCHSCHGRRHRRGA